MRIIQQPTSAKGTTEHPGTARARVARSALLCLALILAAACGTSDAADLSRKAGDAAAPAVTPPREEPDPSPELEAILEDVRVPDLLPAGEHVPAVPPKNGADEPVTLDETALLACASAQFAWVAIQAGNDGEVDTDLGVAAIRAGESSVRAVATQSEPLARAVDISNPLPVIEKFLKLCTDNGFETS